jgi:hypothetical protein
MCDQRGRRHSSEAAGGEGRKGAARQPRGSKIPPPTFVALPRLANATFIPSLSKIAATALGRL